MRFYRRLQPIKALSFDLDDTLYDNGPVLINAEQELMMFLRANLNSDKAGDPQFWRRLKISLLANQPELSNDTTRWRQLTLESGITSFGVTNASEMAQQAMDLFLRHRSDITVADHIIELLSDLSSRYALAVITNGNADVGRFLPQVPFKAVLQAGRHGPMKPDTSMFLSCCAQLNVEPNQLLHIGDHADSDIRGALEAGCQAAWLSPRADGRIEPSGCRLPTLEIRSLEALRHLP